MIPFNEVPLLSKLGSEISNIFEDREQSEYCATLPCEANYYYDVKDCGIGFHGDSDSKRVIGVRLGARFSLHFQWFHMGRPIGDRFQTTLDHGDLYFMSDKTVGYDWERKTGSHHKYTLRHAAGGKKHTTIDKFECQNEKGEWHSKDPVLAES